MKVRNKLLVLFWFMYLVSFMDRVNFSVALPAIGNELQLTHFQMGLALGSFHIGYGLFQIIGGMLGDKYGGRKVLTFALLWWSLFTALTGFATKFAHLMIIRPLFGAGEAMHPPTCLKLIADWFPEKERVRASSLHMCAMALGPAVAPPLVVLVVQAMSWHYVFFLFSIPGFVLAWFVWRGVRGKPSEHPAISNQERAEIEAGMADSSAAESGATRKGALRHPVLWTVTIMYLLHGIVFWGYVTWLPTFLVDARGFSMTKMGFVATIPFLCGFIGMISAEWILRNIFKDHLQWFIGICFLIAGIFMCVSFYAANEILCVVALSMTATFGLFLPQGAIWVIPMQTLSSNIMGFATGFINTGGQIGGAIAPVIIGFLIDWTRSYAAGFVLMAVCLVLCAIMIFSIRSPKAMNTNIRRI